MQHVLTIAGSDSGGGAGIQADLKTFSALGVYGLSVITAITAQNTLGVQAIETLSSHIVAKQLESVFSDIRIDAVKIGMVAEKFIIHEIAEAIKRYKPPIVIVDPVMVSTSGHRLLEPDQVDALRTKLFPICSLMTPNLHEAELLYGSSIHSHSIMQAVVADLASTFGCEVLLKGGHLPVRDSSGTQVSIDYLSDGTTFTEEWVISEHTHGTGCSLSSAIAALWARGYERNEAIRLAKLYVTKGIRNAYAVGQGSGPIHHFHSLWRAGGSL
ncbi:bifunctional hydroxymethylpyrimidine kinase/phosphomethylpyrimidine kinase [Paenibacillus albiflavus]|uniref:Hydroxymethylpyrimidine/phosphomethylpyrimidine kinase n=1 Tax=Paenibacillus albiflavus TaxID=2545760 RepID=A0A4R4E311_9BACL|nr:bifunctional hydroxymethylpyrimidine kinase/phosphomethylpyrimidine kinase [Paenibacillus albiflavus]TCZ73183.1 bifunctional hydroxymethylpyrimidine kinase/phosphomethylpyrimidine kinase [Paenibacillus albiflavus]